MQNNDSNKFETQSPKPIWERQPYENDNMYRAFRIYLDSKGIRRVTEAYRIYRGRIGGTDQAPGYFWYWSQGRKGNNGGDHMPGSHKWEERARAYDDYMASEAIEAGRQRAREVAERLVKEKIGRLEVANAYFQRAQALIEDGDLDRRQLFDTTIVRPATDSEGRPLLHPRTGEPLTTKTTVPGMERMLYAMARIAQEAEENLEKLAREGGEQAPGMVESPENSESLVEILCRAMGEEPDKDNMLPAWMKRGGEQDCVDGEVVEEPRGL